MAYISDDLSLDQEDPNKKTSADASPTQLSASSGVTSPSSTAASGDAASKPSQSGWTNLNQYLDANKDQAAKIGSDVANTISSEATGAQDSLKQAQGAFTAAADTGGPSLVKDQSTIDATLADPVNASADPSKIAAFQNDLNSSYKGPNSLQDMGGYADAASKYNKANADLSMTGTESGRMGLLQNQFARPDYNQGQQSLDQLLLEGNPNAQSSLSNLGGKFSGIMNELGQANSDSSNYAAGRAADAKAANNYASTQEAAAFNPITAGINSRVQAANQAETALRGGVDQNKALLQSGTITNDLARQLGLLDMHSSYAGGDLAMQDSTQPNNLKMQTYGIDPSRYLNYKQGDVANTSNIANASEAAQINALYALMGQQNTTIADPSKVGTYKAGSAVLDPTFRKDVDAAHTEVLRQQAAAYQPGYGANNAGITDAYNTFLNTYDPNKPGT